MRYTGCTGDSPRPPDESDGSGSPASRRRGVRELGWFCSCFVAGPQPQFLLDSEHFTVVIVGLEAGQKIPDHAEAMAMYHFLEGKGTMKVNEQTYPIVPGATLIALPGANRGIQAETRLVFLAAKSQ